MRQVHSTLRKHIEENESISQGGDINSNDSTEEEEKKSVISNKYQLNINLRELLSPIVDAINSLTTTGYATEGLVLPTFLVNDSKKFHVRNDVIPISILQFVQDLDDMLGILQNFKYNFLSSY